jgi:hypothetical protein
MEQLPQELGAGVPSEVTLFVVPSTMAKVARAHGKIRAVSDDEWAALERAGATVTSHD